MLDRAEALERTWLELGEYGFDVEYAGDAVTVRQPRGGIFSTAGVCALVSHGRVSLSTDERGRHSLEASLVVRPAGLLITVLGLGFPLACCRYQWQTLLDAIRDRYLARKSPERQLVSRAGPPNHDL
jgi:hypothetical protein